MNNYPDYKVEKVNNFFQLFVRMQGFGNAVAFCDDGNDVTYAKLCQDICKTSQLFCSHEKKILINVKNKYLFTVAYFATVLSGNVACLQPYSTQVCSCFAKFEFELIVTDDVVLQQIARDNCAINLADNDGIATVLCSSGTTALPKAVALTQHGIISDMVAGMEKYTFENFGRYVSILPYTHAFGLTCDLLAPLYSRSCILPVYDVVTFFGALPKFNPTALNVTPAVVEALAGRIKAVGNVTAVVGTNLKKILSGGAGTPSAICNVMRSYGIGVYGCYGLSECSPCVCVNRDDYYKDGSAGIMLNCNEVSILANGQIVICGTNVMAGYLDENGTLAQPTNGKYVSGDIGYLDGDGFLYVQGRVDDLIVFADGTKLMPQTLESQLALLDGVKESVVFAQDDQLYTVVVTTDIAKKSQLENTISQGNYNGYKFACVTITDTPLSKNALGKLNRSFYGQKRDN